MRVLIACEESQEVCKAFRNLGYEAWSCDLQPASGGYPEWHIQDDVLYHLNESWDLIIAHPPCTYLSKAGARHMYKVIDGEPYINAKRYELMLQGKSFFMKMLNAACNYIAVENPTPLKICDLPHPSQVIQPYEYGHPYSKRTLLWLKNLPPLQPTEVLTEYSTYLPSNTSMFANGHGGGKGIAHDPKDRSRTFSGIAKAMAEQWGKYVESGNEYPCYEEQQISMF